METILFNCSSCGRKFNREIKVLPFYCACGHVTTEIDYQRFNVFAISQDQDLACKHRGNEIREIDCGCSGKQYIYECSKYGTCFKRKTPKMRLEQVSGATMCLTCEDREQFDRGSLGVLSCVLNPIGGTETYWNQLNDALGIVGLATPKKPIAKKAKFRFSYGEKAIRDLADSVEQLIVWGVSDADQLTKGPKRIAIHHGSLKSSWANSIFEKQLSWCEKAVAIDPEVADRYGCKLIPNAIDLSRIAGRPKQTDKKVVLWLHREAQEKRPYLAKAISRKLPEGWVMIASLGKQQATENLIPIGQVTHPGDWLQTATVFLSTSDQEGFGYSVAEAIAAGVPCVSAPVGVAKDPDLFSLVESEDPDEWVSAILKAAERKGTKEFEAKRSEFVATHSVDRWVENWKKLLAGEL